MIRQTGGGRPARDHSGWHLLRPQKVIDATQVWFWSADCQAVERDADEDREAERAETFSAHEAFVSASRSRAKRSDRRSGQ